MSLPLSQTVALVTGGSSGLGAAAVRHLAKQGAKVMIADLHEPSSSSAATMTRSGSVYYAKVDVTDEQSISDALDKVQETFGKPLTACVQCAGIATARKMISAKGKLHPLEEFTRTLQVNTIGTFSVARLAVERMQENNPVDHPDGLRGCLIHTASIAAYEGQIGQVAYAASKSAIVGMTLPMARDLAPLGIRVMAIVRAEIKFTYSFSRLHLKMVEGHLSHSF